MVKFTLKHRPNSRHHLAIGMSPRGHTFRQNRNKNYHNISEHKFKNIAKFVSKHTNAMDVNITPLKKSRRGRTLKVKLNANISTEPPRRSGRKTKSEFGSNLMEIKKDLVKAGVKPKKVKQIVNDVKNVASSSANLQEKLTGVIKQAEVVHKQEEELAENINNITNFFGKMKPSENNNMSGGKRR